MADLDPALAAQAYAQAQQRLGIPDLAQQALAQMSPVPAPVDPGLMYTPAAPEQVGGLGEPEPDPGLYYQPAPLAGADPEPAQAGAPAPVAGAFAQPPAQSRAQQPGAVNALADLSPLAGRAGGRMPRSPLPAMEAEAAARRAPEEARFAAEREQADVASAAAQQAEQEAGDARAAAQEQIAQVQSDIALRTEAERERMGRTQAREEQIFAQAQARLGEITARMRERSKERPGRQNIAQRVGGAVATALAGLGDSYMHVASIYSGQRLPADNADAVVAMINNGIQRDLDEQARAAEQDKDAFAATQSELATALQETGNMRAAQQAAWVSQLEQAQAELAAITARGASAEAKALADSAIAKLELQRAQAERDLSLTLSQGYREQQQKLQLAQYEQAKAAAGGGMTPERALKLRKLGADISKTEAETGKLLREAEGGGEIKAEAAKALRLYDSAATDADRLESLLNAEGGDLPGVGKIAGRLPDAIAGKDGRQLRRSVRRMVKNMLRDESGAAIGVEEAEAYMQDRGLDFNASNYEFEEGLRETLQEFRTKHDLVRQQAGRKPEDRSPAAGRVRGGAAQ